MQYPPQKVKLNTRKKNYVDVNQAAWVVGKAAGLLERQYPMDVILGCHSIVVIGTRPNWI